MARPAIARVTELVCRSTAVGDTDAELLARFAQSRDPGALAEVVRRHGSLVRGAAGRWLPGADAVDDVFQATFLLLAQKAGQKRWGSSVGPWLYAVAVRLARKALPKPAVARRADVAADDLVAPTVDPSAPLAWAEVRQALDEELGRLPGRLRDPLVLCFLEGHTRDEAARLLGWSLATLKRRLERGRNLLRDRLTRRGLALAVAGVGPLLVGPPVSAVAARATAAAVLRFLSSGQTPSPIAALVAASRTSASGVRLVAVLTISFGVCAFAAMALTAENRAPATPPDTGATAKVLEQAVPTDSVGDPLPAGAVARLGSTRLRPGAVVQLMAFSPDGSKLASWANDDCFGALTVWDTTTGRLLRRVRPSGALDLSTLHWLADGRGIAVVSYGAAAPPSIWEFTDESSVPSAAAWIGVAPDRAHAVSPDGKTIAIGRSLGPGKGYTLELHLLKTGDQTDQLAAGRVLTAGRGECQKLIYSRDGKTLVSVHEPEDRIDPDGRHLVTVWDVDSGRQKARFTVPRAAENFNRQAIDLWGRSLVVGQVRKDPVLCDLETGKERAFLTGDGHTRPGEWRSAYAVAFSPDGSTLASSTWATDRTGFGGLVDLWQMAEGRHVRVFDRHGGALQSLAFSPDGKTLAAAGQDRRIRLWDVRSGAERCPQPGHRGPLSAGAFAPDGKTVVTFALDCTVRWWDALTGREIRQAVVPTFVKAAVVSPDGGTLLALLGSEAVRTWDMKTGRETTPNELGGDRKFNGFTFTPDGRHLLGATGNQVRVWQWPALKLDHTITLPRPDNGPGETRCLSVATSSDSRWLVTLAVRRPPPEPANAGVSLVDGVVDLWDLATGKRVRRLAEAPGCIGGAHFTADGRVIVIGATCVTVPGNPVSTGEDNVHVIDPATGRRVYSLSLPPPQRDNCTRLGMPGTVTVSRDGRTLYDGQVFGTIVGFELATGSARHQFSGHENKIPALALSPDGRRLLSGSADGTAIIWDVTLAAVPADPGGPPVPTDADGLWETSGSPDARLAATAMGRLVRSRDHGVDVIRRKLKPVPAPPTEADLDAIFRDLDGPVFTTRENASRRLVLYREAAVAGVRKRLERKTPAEARQRAEAFLARFDADAPSTDRLREIRAVEVLEEIATPAARAYLAELAAGAAGTPLTRDAAGALGRLTGR